MSSFVSPTGTIMLSIVSPTSTLTLSIVSPGTLTVCRAFDRVSFNSTLSSSVINSIYVQLCALMFSLFYCFFRSNVKGLPAHCTSRVAQLALSVCAWNRAMKYSNL